MSSACLFTPLKLRGAELRNRVVMGPMMQYSCEDGLAGDWHMAHLGSRAIGGAGLVMVEQTAVSPEGRSTHADLGIWRDDQARALAPIARFIASQDAIPGIQLGHSGRKASIRPPWADRSLLTIDQGGWTPLGPSAIPCAEGRLVPEEMTETQIWRAIEQFAAAATRAVQAGFRLVEIHGAHGYLPHQFLSPLSNKREDRFGGKLEGRSRFMRELVRAMRAALPPDIPLALRISALDAVDGGYPLTEVLELVPLLTADGVDLFDVSIGGIGARHDYPTEPAAMAPVAGRIKAVTSAHVGVGWGIGSPQVAESVIASGQADLVFIARAMLRDPYWASHASEALDCGSLLPVQIRR